MKGETENKNSQRYVDILSNAGFKAFFGDESNKEEVMMLINTLLPAHRQVKDIEYRSTEHQGPVIGHSKDFKFDRYISEYTFREKECHDLLDETIVIIFAELTRFHKAEDECVTLQDRLLYLLKNSGKMRTPPKWGTEKPCKDLLDAFEIEDFSKQKREQYDKDMYDEKRRNGELAAARNDGRAEGHAEGHAEGLAEAQTEIAKRMLAAGMSVEQIVQFTGLDFDAVMNLQ